MVLKIVGANLLASSACLPYPENLLGAEFQIEEAKVPADWFWSCYALLHGPLLRLWRTKGEPLQVFVAMAIGIVMCLTCFHCIGPSICLRFAGGCAGFTLYTFCFPIDVVVVLVLVRGGVGVVVIVDDVMM